MLVLLILFVVSCLYVAYNLPKIKKLNKEIEKENVLKTKARAEKLKKKIKKIKQEKK